MNKLTPRLMSEIAKKIIHEYQNGCTDTNELHTKLKIPLRTIERYVKNFNNGMSLADFRAVGRPRVLTPTDNIAISQCLRRNISTYLILHIRSFLPHQSSCLRWWVTPFP